MDDLESKIIELMDLFDGEVTTADKIDRPERALEKEAIDDFNKRNPMAGGGMLVSPSADGSRPEYGGPQPGSVKNRFREWVKTADKEFLKTASIEDIIKKSKIKINNRNALNVFAEDEFKKFRPTRDFDESARTDLKKLLKNKTGRMESVKYKGKEYYKANDGRIREKISLKADRPEAYEEKRIKQQKKADLIKNKDIFPSVGKDTKLMIWRDLYDSTKKRTYGPRVGDYEVPEPRLKMVNKGKINLTTDFVKNKLVLLDTKTGKKITFKNLEKYINNLPGISYKDMELPYKYKTWLSDQTINYKGRTNVSLRTILRENLLTENELENFRFSPYEVHHPFGKNENPFKVALAMRKANGAEGNIRLETLKELDKAGITEKDVDRILNNFEKKINKLGGIQSGVRDVLVGEELSPENFFKKLTSEAKIGREVRPLKQDFLKEIARLSPDPSCSVFKTGRIGKSNGGDFAKLNSCVEGGVKAINERKIPNEKATDFLKILKGGSNVVRNVAKYGVIPEAFIFTADALARTALGDTWKEAGLRASDYILPGDQTKEADIEKVSRVFNDRTGELVGKSIDYKNTVNRINSLEAQKRNLETTNVPSDFGYFDSSSDIKNLDANIAQAKKDLENKFFVPLEQRLFADRKLDEAYDVSKAGSSAMKKLGSVRETAEAMKDTEDFSGLQSDAQAPTPLNLDLSLLPNFRKDMEIAKTLGSVSAEEARKYFKERGESPDEFLAFQESFKNLKNLPLSNLAQLYGDEQIYGTQGASALGEPLAEGGIAGLSGGDKSGPPPERGPNSEGLSSLLKRGTNI